MKLKESGEACVIGSIVGFSDYKTATGEAGSVNIGKFASVFQTAKSDLPETPAVLETANSGKYAILKPTIEGLQANFLAAAREVFGGRQ